MVSLQASPSTSEHWLTIMTCTVCESSPEASPLYRCSMGHVICGYCFDKLLLQGDSIRCQKCGCSKFRKCIVSEDFLQKLKNKPGIGRRRRYCLLDSNESCLDVSDCLFEEPAKKDPVTVEKLFQLSSDQISKLFEATAKEKFKKKTAYERGDNGSFTLVSPKTETDLLSRRPMSCPHYDCGKLITLSTFADHFQYDHCDIPVFGIERGRTAHLLHDVRMIEFNTTFCLAILKVCEEQGDAQLGTFWLLVSGSIEEQKSKSYVLYWVATNSADAFNCTIEMSSLKENVCNSTFCAVDKISDSYNVSDIAYRLNCLNLCYYSLRNLLQEGCKLHLRVTIH